MLGTKEVSGRTPLPGPPTGAPGPGHPQLDPFDSEILAMTAAIAQARREAGSILFFSLLVGLTLLF